MLIHVIVFPKKKRHNDPGQVSNPGHSIRSQAWPKTASENTLVYLRLATIFEENLKVLINQDETLNKDSYFQEMLINLPLH